MAVNQAGQDRHITQVDFLHISWRVLANVCDRPDLLDAVSLDPDPAILEDLARLHVHQARGPDQRRLRGLLRLLGIRVGEQCQRSRRYQAEEDRSGRGSHHNERKLRRSVSRSARRQD